ncbi:MAG: hypothetical protein ACK4UK_01495, partial [Flavobacterium sp.]
MKKTLLFLLLTFIYSSQAQSLEWDLIAQSSETKILYDRVFGLSKITSKEKSVTSSNYVKQVYHEIQRADMLTRWPAFEHVKHLSKQAQINKVNPIIVVISDIEYIHPELDQNDILELNHDGKYILKSGIEQPILKKSVRLAAPLLGQSRDAQVSFVFDPTLVFTTTHVEATSLELDAHNGNGFQKLMPHQNITVYFDSAGKKDITLKVGFSDGSIKLITSSIEILSNPTVHQSTQQVQTIQASIPYQGYGESAPLLGQAEYEIYLDNVDGVLDKPIFLIDGFDPGDTRNTSMIYQS